MNGELDFTESLRARVALLRGVRADVFEKLKSVITITPGARELCRALKRLGFKMAVLSGGFTPLAEWLAAQLGLDYASANNVRDIFSSRLRFIRSPSFSHLFIFGNFPNTLDWALRLFVILRHASENRCRRIDFICHWARF